MRLGQCDGSSGVVLAGGGQLGTVLRTCPQVAQEEVAGQIQVVREIDLVLQLGHVEAPLREACRRVGRGHVARKSDPVAGSLVQNHETSLRAAKETTAAFGGRRWEQDRHRLFVIEAVRVDVLVVPILVRGADRIAEAPPAFRARELSIRVDLKILFPAKRARWCFIYVAARVEDPRQWAECDRFVF